MLLDVRRHAIVEVMKHGEEEYVSRLVVGIVIECILSSLVVAAHASPREFTEVGELRQEPSVDMKIKAECGGVDVLQQQTRSYFCIGGEQLLAEQHDGSQRILEPPPDASPWCQCIKILRIHFIIHHSTVFRFL
jgi:hypothetical protein